MAKKSPAKFLFGLGVGASLQLIGTGIGLYQGYKSRKQQKKQMRQQQAQADAIAQQTLDFQKEQQIKLDQQKAEYAAMKFSNPYSGFGEKFGEVGELYSETAASMENMFEDLTLDQQAANFHKRALEQQSANILDRLQQSAGSSGISALAQQLANQQALSTSKISADIAKQERQNQLLAAKGADDLQKQRANLQLQGAQLGLKGEQIEAMGEGMLQEAEMSRQATLLGMQYGQSSGANMAYQQAMQNQLAAQNMGNQMNMSNAALTSGLFQNLSNIDFSGFDFSKGIGSS